MATHLTILSGLGYLLGSGVIVGNDLNYPQLIGQAFFDSDFATAERYAQQVADRFKDKTRDHLGYAKALRGLGQIQMFTERYDTSVDSLRSALKAAELGSGGAVDPAERPYFEFSLGQALTWTGEYDEAERHLLTAWRALRHVETYSPSRSNLLLQLGCSYSGAGRLTDAERCAAAADNEARRQRETRDYAQAVLAEVHIKAGRYAEAEQILKDRNGFLASCVVPDQRAWLDIRTGNPARAAEDMRQRLEPDRVGRRTRKAAFTLALGAAECRLGDEKAGRRHLLDAVTRYEVLFGRNHPKVAYALEVFCEYFPDDCVDARKRIVAIRSRVVAKPLVGPAEVLADYKK